MSGHIAKLNRRYEALVNKFNEQKKLLYCFLRMVKFLKFQKT